MAAIGFEPTVGCFYVQDTTIEVELLVDGSYVHGFGSVNSSFNSSESTNSINSSSNS